MSDEQLERLSTKLRRMDTAARSLGGIKGVAWVGIALAVGFALTSFIMYEDRSRAGWIVRVGAMGCLVVAVISLNVMDRLVRRAALPLGWIAIALGLLTLGLMTVTYMALNYQLGGAWSPLAAAIFSFVLARLLLRLRKST